MKKPMMNQATAPARTTPRPVRSRRAPLFILNCRTMPAGIAMLVSVVLVGCSSPSGGRTSGTVVTFPAPDRAADLSVRIRADATFDQVSDLISRASLQLTSVMDGYRIDYEARTVLVYLL